MGSIITIEKFKNRNVWNLKLHIIIYIKGWEKGKPKNKREIDIKLKIKISKKILMKNIFKKLRIKK